MEIEVGEYVRTESGQIYKLSYYNEEEKRWISVTNEDWFPVYTSEIVKHSKNIIDLIEAGDYVNGKRVIYVASIENKDDKEELCVFVEETQDCIEAKDIKSIVTKEQFAEMEYKVGEE